jgi:hypothetical protein
MSDGNELIPHAALKRRWSRSPVTIWRWAKQPDFPPAAAVINDRRFYRLTDIEAYETRGLADAPAPSPRALVAAA